MHADKRRVLRIGRAAEVAANHLLQVSPTLVLTDKIPTGINPVAYDKEGHRVLIEGLQLDIVDESMKKTIADFPYHLRNGRQIAKMGRSRRTASRISGSVVASRSGSCRISGWLGAAP